MASSIERYSTNGNLTTREYGSIGPGAKVQHLANGRGKVIGFSNTGKIKVAFDGGKHFAYQDKDFQNGMIWPTQVEGKSTKALMAQAASLRRAAQKKRAEAEKQRSKELKHVEPKGEEAPFVGKVGSDVRVNGLGDGKIIGFTLDGKSVHVSFRGGKRQVVSKAAFASGKATLLKPKKKTTKPMKTRPQKKTDRDKPLKVAVGMCEEKQSSSESRFRYVKREAAPEVVARITEKPSPTAPIDHKAQAYTEPPRKPLHGKTCSGCARLKNGTCESGGFAICDDYIEAGKMPDYWPEMRKGGSGWGSPEKGMEADLTFGGAGIGRKKNSKPKQQKKQVASTAKTNTKPRPARQVTTSYPDASSLRINGKVTHKKMGQGVIVGLTQHTVTVKFQKERKGKSEIEFPIKTAFQQGVLKLQ